MVFNGDVLSGADLGAMLGAHHERDADVTLHLVRVSDPRAFGSVPTDADGNVLAFLEKTEDPPTDQINAGTYIFKRSVIDRIPRGREVSVEREVFPAPAGRRRARCAATSTPPTGATWEPRRTSSAARPTWCAVSPRRRRWTAGAARAWCTTAPRWPPGALLIGGTVVGRGAEIGPGVRLDGAVVFDGARIEAGAVVERSIIGFGARIGPRALIRDGVIADGADIGARCELLRGARVWPGVVDPRLRYPLLQRCLTPYGYGRGPLPPSRASPGRFVGQRVERPPAQVQRLVADHVACTGRCVGDELQIEVAGRHAQRAGHRVHVDGSQLGFEAQTRRCRIPRWPPAGRRRRCRRRIPRSARRVAASGRTVGAA